ncbi:MAG: N-acetylmuramoyl-L-alanine amidase, partial [candidate division WOR-3 bacterium]
MKRLVVFILTTGLVNAAYKICLDPGHGGSDPGATGSYFTEKEANLHVANWAKHFM